MQRYSLVLVSQDGIWLGIPDEMDAFRFMSSCRAQPNTRLKQPGARGMGFPSAEEVPMAVRGRMNLHRGRLPACSLSANR
jgi:hypothetical protein